MQIMHNKAMNWTMPLFIRALKTSNKLKMKKKKKDKELNTLSGCFKRMQKSIIRDAKSFAKI